MDVSLNRSEKPRNTASPLPGFTHSVLNRALLDQRIKAERIGIRTELRVADLGKLPVQDEVLCTVLSAITDDAIQIAHNSERKRLYTAVLIRSGQLIISVKASAGTVASPQDAVLFASLGRNDITEIRKLCEKTGGNFVCTCDNGMVCYTYCLSLFY